MLGKVPCLYLQFQVLLRFLPVNTISFSDGHLASAPVSISQVTILPI